MMKTDTITVLKNTEVAPLRDMQEIYLEARSEQEQELLALDYAYGAWLDTLDMQQAMEKG